MTYGDLYRLYPNIEQLFERVSDMSHNDLIPREAVLEWAYRWISLHIDPLHQGAVAAKVRAFISAVEFAKPDPTTRQLSLYQQEDCL